MIAVAEHDQVTQGLNGDSLCAGLNAIALRHQRALAEDPRNPQALIAMSLVAMASRQADASVKMARAAVAVAPAMTTAWVTLGQALKSAHMLAESEAAYRSAILLDGISPLAHMGLAELQITLEKPDEALREYELVLRGNPAMVAAHLGTGHALACMGRYAEALARYEQALALQPRLSEAEFAAGFALARLRRPTEAEVRYRRAIRLRPDFAAAWMNLGSLLREQGRDLYAEAALERATHLRPDMVSGWLNLALLMRDRQQPAEAERHLRKAFALDPHNLETHVAWCQFRAAERDFAGAWGWLRWALARHGSHDETVNMYGILLHAEGRFADAVAQFERAEALGSRHAASNRGNSLLDQGRFDEALAAHAASVESDPESHGARYNLALTQLRLGHWTQGWHNYEARWHFREVHRRPRVFDQPRWCGEVLDGQRVLLHAEQGLGDTIQFCRYAALVAARGGVPVLQVQAPVERLLLSLPVVRAGLAEVVRLGPQAGQPPAFELECPFMSLPAVLGTTLETVPWPGAYLGAYSDQITERLARSPEVPISNRGCLRVGIAWAGNPRYKADAQRSMKLATLLPLLRMVGIDWISLQKGHASTQIATLPPDVHLHDGSSDDSDLADTAALVASLDLVITTDTCIAHLAGAMAKPVWILLPHLADWRWMQGMETTPWYPPARLLRQSSTGDWAGVVSRVIASLPSMKPARCLPWQPSPQASPDRPAHAA